MSVVKQKARSEAESARNKLASLPASFYQAQNSRNFELLLRQIAAS
jgi:hypothetical protein